MARTAGSKRDRGLWQQAPLTTMNPQQPNPPPKGSGCLTWLLVFLFGALMTGNPQPPCDGRRYGPPRPDFYPDEVMPPWEPMPPPELLDNPDDPYGDDYP